MFCPAFNVTIAFLNPGLIPKITTRLRFLFLAASMFMDSTATPYLASMACFKENLFAEPATLKTYFPSPSMVDFSEICGATINLHASSDLFLVWDGAAALGCWWLAGGLRPRNSSEGRVNGPTT